MRLVQRRSAVQPFGFEQPAHAFTRTFERRLHRERIGVRIRLVFLDISPDSAYAHYRNTILMRGWLTKSPILAGPREALRHAPAKTRRQMILVKRFTITTPVAIATVLPRSNHRRSCLAFPNGRSCSRSSILLSLPAETASETYLGHRRRAVVRRRNRGTRL